MVVYFNNGRKMRCTIKLPLKIFSITILLYILIRYVYWDHAPNVVEEYRYVTEDYMIGLSYNNDDISKRNKGYDDYGFNILISDRIGFRRNIPDTRDGACKGVKYGHIALSTSIVICFHNEAWSVLLRTICSIHSRTKPHLVKEIILIDDASNSDTTCSEIENSSHNFLSKVICKRSEKRLGLMRARNMGAKLSKGDILVFLDSHCEVNKNWLIPLVSEIQEKRHTVAVPLIDSINPNTLSYKSSPLVKGTFDWSMSFQWEDITEQIKDTAKPYFTTTMSGGLFAIDREYFFFLGEYDDKMEIWGAENLEISFRVWMCGGVIKIIPCSRVGHLFRDRRPYDNAGLGNVEGRNTVRMVEVWLDDFKKEFYSRRPELKNMKVDVEERKKLRNRLKCKPFKWYLHNVNPALLDGDMPLIHRGDFAPSKILYSGQLLNIRWGKCLDVADSEIRKKLRLRVRSCQSIVVEHVEMNLEGELKLNNKICVDALSYVSVNSDVYSMKCDGREGTQLWTYGKPSSKHLYNPASGMCLSVDEKKHVVLSICNNDDVTQMWYFQSRPVKEN